MKKYLNKYTIVIAVVLLIAAGFRLNSYFDKAYLTEYLSNDSLEIYIINETTGEILTNNEQSQGSMLLSLEEEVRVMDYLRGFELGKAEQKQEIDSASSWYNILLADKNGGIVSIAVYNSARMDYINCRKFAGNVSFKPEFFGYLDSLFNLKQLD